MGVVTSQLPFDGLDVLSCPNSFRPIIEFNDKVECAALSRHKLEYAIGIHGESTRFEFDAVFASEVAKSNPVLMSRRDQVDDHICERHGVMVMTVADLLEVSSAWQRGLASIEQPIAVPR